MTPECKCDLPPGIYRVSSDGSIHHVTKVIVHDAPPPLSWNLLGFGSIGTLIRLVIFAYIMHRKRLIREANNLRYDEGDFYP